MRIMPIVTAAAGRADAPGVACRGERAVQVRGVELTDVGDGDDVAEHLDRTSPRRPASPGRRSTAAAATATTAGGAQDRGDREDHSPALEAGAAG